MILCEGYTDMIALHQAGMRNAVGLMGTALTGEQVGELARMAQTVLLALDADSGRSGGDAARVQRWRRRRKLELRVVPLPAGADPAELVAARRAGGDERGGGTARFRSCASASSGCWRPAITSSPEGRDRMIEELRAGVRHAAARARCAWS